MRPAPMMPTFILRFSIRVFLDAENSQKQMPEEDENGWIALEYLRASYGSNQPPEFQAPPNRCHRSFISGVPVEHRADRDRQFGTYPIPMFMRPLFLLRCGHPDKDDVRTECADLVQHAPVILIVELRLEWGRIDLDGYIRVLRRRPALDLLQSFIGRSEEKSPAVQRVELADEEGKHIGALIRLDKPPLQENARQPKIYAIKHEVIGAGERLAKIRILRGYSVGIRTDSGDGRAR